MRAVWAHKTVVLANHTHTPQKHPAPFYTFMPFFLPLSMYRHTAYSMQQSLEKLTTLAYYRFQSDAFFLKKKKILPSFFPSFHFPLAPSWVPESLSFPSIYENIKPSSRVWSNWRWGQRKNRRYGKLCAHDKMNIYLYIYIISKEHQWMQQ